MLFIKLAWRNLFRNKRRTIIAGTAIGLGLAALIFTDALIIGEVEYMIHTVTSSFAGEAQISREGYRDAFESDLTIKNFNEVMESLDTETIVDGFTPRIGVFGTISSPANMAGVEVFGVAPESERDLSYLDENIIKGEYFTSDNPRDILIGEKLADILEVGLDDRVVITMAQAGSGDLVQELFRVSGIFDFGERAMNRGVVFIRIEKAREMLAIGNTAHLIAVKFTNPAMSEDTTLAFWDKYSTGNNKAVSWQELFPQIVSMFDWVVIGKVIISFILMGVVVFVILNTLFMSLYERMFEFGVLRAVGTRPFEVAKLMLFEAGALSVISIIIGSIIGFAVTYLFTQIGMDFGGMEAVGITFKEKLYPVFSAGQFIIYPIGVFLFTIIVGIYPAVHAARMVPAKAMRKSL